MSERRAREGGFLVMPVYDTDKDGNDVEIDIPDPKYFMAVGYDRKPRDGIMHYRYVVRKELENCKRYIDDCPFAKFHAFQGQDRGLEDEITAVKDRVDDSGEGSNLESRGVFKGLIRVIRADEEQSRMEKVDRIKEKRTETKHLILQNKLFDAVKNEADNTDDEDEDFQEITKKLLCKTECIVRVYILDCKGIMQKDEDSLSDPYVLVKLGKKVFGDPEKYIEDKESVEFCEVFDIDTELPGPSILKIEVWDHDDVFPDEMVGRTVIDLEDRFFSNRWIKLKEKPVETRTLYHKSTKVPQGVLRMWVDIIPKAMKMDKSLNKKWDISPRPPVEVEARLIIWETDDVEAVDYEGTTDMYIRAWIND
jgi:hypothetical protein